MNPLVSIVIPAHNSEKFIKEAILSVLSQDYSPIEVIVIDDGSTDNTTNIAKDIASVSSNLKYFYQTNRGKSTSRNKGFNESKGEYIIFLDNDDMLSAGMAKIGIEALRNNPDYRAVYGIAYRLNEINKTYTEYLYTPRQNGDIFEFIIKGLVLAQGQYVLHRSIIEELGGFDEEVYDGEDWPFQLKVAKRFPFLFIPYQFMTKRIHPRMVTLNKEKDMDYVRNRLSHIERTFGKEAKQIKDKYVTRRVLADWYYCFDRKWKSLFVYPWQPRIYRDLLRQNLAQAVITKAKQLLRAQ